LQLQLLNSLDDDHSLSHSSEFCIGAREAAATRTITSRGVVFSWGRTIVVHGGVRPFVVPRAGERESVRPPNRSARRLPDCGICFSGERSPAIVIEGQKYLDQMLHLKASYSEPKHSENEK